MCSLSGNGDGDAKRWLEDCTKKFGGIGLKRQAKSIVSARVDDAVPINIRLEKGFFTPGPRLTPRRYQEELYLKSLEENVIIYLGTGLGKTFITVLSLCSPKYDSLIRAGRKVAFLAPTQDLVKQQAEYIYTKVPYRVRVYCGQTAYLGTHIDHWSESAWLAQLQDVDILFMTPQIFCSAISNGLLKWEQFSLVIFDEVHHAASGRKEKSGKKQGTPYSRALKHFKTFCMTGSSKPRFIGLTASLINNMPKDVESIRSDISDLETKLSARCVTDITAIESKPKVIIYKFTKPAINRTNDKVIQTLSQCLVLIETALATAKSNRIGLIGPKDDDEKEVVNYLNRLRLAAHGFSIKPGSFHKIIKQLIAIRINSGLWTFANICFNLYQAVMQHSKSSLVSAEIRVMYAEFAKMLRALTTMCERFLGSEPSGYLLSYSQPKLLCLLELLKQEYQRVLSGDGEQTTFSCIVFVKSRVEVLAVCGWLQQVSSNIAEYDFIKADYAIGLAATQTSKWACITKRKSAEQMAMLNDFRRGNLNVIVTTSVLEEGIDLPVCSTVIRYDPAETFRVYVQSRGRARQQASSFVAMCEATAEGETRDRLNKFNDLEDAVKDLLSANNQSALPSRTPSTSVHAVQSDGGPEDVFVDLEKQIRIDASQAKIILHMYCSRRSKQAPFTDNLMYERRETSEKLFETTLFFPVGCPIKLGVKGGARRTVELADASACVAAYRALLEAGELDEHGVPARFTEEHIDELLDEYGMHPGITPLDKILEGDVMVRNNTPIHIYPWKLFDLQTCLAQAYLRRTYKLYRISFLAAGDDCVRKDTREFFEKQTLGIIVDSKQVHLAWPKKLFSHYGEFDVVYDILDEHVKIETYDAHRDYVNYTYRFVTTYWNLGRIKRDDFREKCQFYIVPLDRRDKIRHRMVKEAFHLRRVQQDYQPNDLVRLRPIYRNYPEDFTRSYIVVEVHHDMDIYSHVPDSKRRETFLDRARARYGPNNFHPQPDRPIIEVRPIAQEVARMTQGKRVDVDQVTRTIFIPEQLLESYEGDLPTAYQAYNLPEIVYKIYLTTLAADLNERFQRATLQERKVVIEPIDIKEYDPKPWSSSEEESDDEEKLAREIVDQNQHDRELGDEHMDVDVNSDPGDSADSEVEEENVHEDAPREGLLDESSDASEVEDDDQPRPNNLYRDILSRQKFYLTERNSLRDMEKWDMSQCNVPSQSSLGIQVESFEASQKYLDTNPMLPEDFIWIYPILESVGNISQALTQFRTGIVGLGDIVPDEQIFDRPGKVVNLKIKPPISLDRISQPFRPMPFEMDLVTALTQKRSGELVNLEMLENIGDSYLKYCTSVELYRRVIRDEGQLTYARSRLVSNKRFAFLAKKQMLGRYAIERKFDMETLSAAFGGRVSYKNRLRPKDLADILEALVGACLLYRGEYEAVMAINWLGLNIFNRDSFSEFHLGAVVFTKPERAVYDQATTELLKSSKKRMERFQEIISYKFSDQSYLVQAFTHPSATLRCTETYERLEFLGDAVLDFLITMILQHSARYTTPGQITNSRSALVNNCTFAKLAIRYKFDVFIQHTNSELFEELNKVNEYAKSEPNLEFMDDYQFDRISKVLGDLFESVAGAIYLDSGCSLDAVSSVFYPMMKDNIDAEIANPTKNIVAQLFEKFAGRDRIVITYSKVQLDADGEDCLTRASCCIHNYRTFHAEGRSKGQAKKRVAAEVMANLPSDEDQRRLDEEYAAILREREAAERASRGRGRGRGGRARGRGGGRSGRYVGSSQRGRGYQSRLDQQPYPQRSNDSYGRGHYSADH